MIAWVGSVPSLIVHSIVFIAFFVTALLGFVSFNTVLLFLTTIVSLEAIYLAIFIQMSVNRQSESLREVEEDIDEIQEDVDEIQEDVEEMVHDVEGIQGEMREDDIREERDTKTLDSLTEDIHKILADLEVLKKKQ